MDVIKIRTYSPTVDKANPHDDPKPVSYEEKKKERATKLQEEAKQTEGFYVKLKTEKHKWKEVVKSKKKEIKIKI